MHLLLKIEATLLSISLFVVLLTWMVGRGGKERRMNPMIDVAKNISMISMLVSMILMLLMVITSIWIWF